MSVLSADPSRSIRRSRVGTWTLVLAQLTTIVLINCVTLSAQANPKKGAPDRGDASVQFRGNRVTYVWSREPFFGPAGPGQSSRFELSIDFRFTFAWMQAQYRRAKQWRKTSDYWKFLANDPFGPGIPGIARTLQRIARQAGVGDVDLVISFVQSIPYHTPGNYQRYPYETLIDGCGDCSDTSLLLAAILKALGYDCVLLDFPGHLAVGLYDLNPKGTYYTDRGRRYSFIETTGTGFDIGDPGSHRGKRATIVRV